MSYFTCKLIKHTKKINDKALINSELKCCKLYTKVLKISVKHGNK